VIGERRVAGHHLDQRQARGLGRGARRGRLRACSPVVLYRIEGGGHGWPGDPQYLPARVIGRISRRLDATKILLDMVTVG